MPLPRPEAVDTTQPAVPLTKAPLGRPTGVIVRDARSSDYAQVAAIQNEFLDFIWRTEDASAEDVARKSELATVFLVAECHGVVTGYISSTQYHSDAGFRDAQALSIYVSRKNHSSGIAKKLLAALIHRLRLLGYRNLIANIDGNNHRSLAFHIRQGFNVMAIGDGVGNRGGDPRDLIVLKRRLDLVCHSCGEPL